MYIIFCTVMDKLTTKQYSLTKLSINSPVAGPNRRYRIWIGLIQRGKHLIIRICTGAFYTGPALSLCAESGLPPLHYQRLTLTAGLLSSIAQLPFTLIHEYLFSKTCTKPIFNRAHTHMWYFLNHSLSHIVKFNCLTHIYPSIPPWTLPPPDIILDLLNFPKNCTNNSIILTHFLNSLPKSLLCYTDGSRIHNRVGIAYCVDSTIYSFRLRNSASVFTAELLAIFHCLETILSGSLPQSPSIVIITDSFSSVHAITDPYSTHSVVTRIFTLLSTFQAISYKVTL